MRRYLVLSRSRQHQHSEYTYLCEAEDPEHAREQTQEAYPDSTAHFVYELVPTVDDSPGVGPPKRTQIMAWLNLTSPEWDTLAPSVQVKLWDALTSKRSV